MSKYVSRSVVMRNGSRVQDLKSFEKNVVTFASQFSMMDGTGTVDLTAKHTFSINQVIRKASPKIDYSDVQDEAWSIELDGGTRIEYEGVDFLEEGQVTVDKEKEVVLPLLFAATGRTIR